MDKTAIDKHFEVFFPDVEEAKLGIHIHFYSFFGFFIFVELSVQREWV